jgi:hypothetical protein
MVCQHCLVITSSLACSAFSGKETGWATWMGKPNNLNILLSNLARHPSAHKADVGLTHLSQAQIQLIVGNLGSLLATWGPWRPLSSECMGRPCDVEGRGRGAFFRHDCQYKWLSTPTGSGYLTSTCWSQLGVALDHSPSSLLDLWVQPHPLSSP